MLRFYDENWGLSRKIQATQAIKVVETVTNPFGHSNVMDVIRQSTQEKQLVTNAFYNT